jgi:hypothetical protein
VNSDQGHFYSSERDEKMASQITRTRQSRPSATASLASGRSRVRLPPANLATLRRDEGASGSSPCSWCLLWGKRAAQRGVFPGDDDQGDAQSRAEGSR